jgi:hypothetical protein
VRGIGKRLHVILADFSSRRKSVRKGWVWWRVWMTTSYAKFALRRLIGVVGILSVVEYLNNVFLKMRYGATPLTISLSLSLL